MDLDERNFAKRVASFHVLLQSSGKRVVSVVKEKPMEEGES